MNETLNYYADHAQEFLTSTLEADMSATYARVLPLIPAGAAILDLGCGSGRDSLAFKKLGYQVTAADGSRELAQSAQQLLGQAVLCAEFKALELPSKHFDLIWACASLVHVPLKELPELLIKLKESLKPGGLWYMSFKYGDFEGLRGGRYYTDLTEARLRDVIRQVPGLMVKEMWVSEDVRANVTGKWLSGIVEKK